MRRRIFGRRAEKLSEEDRRQLLLFNEAEDILLAQSSQPPDEHTVEVRAHSRHKRGRKPLPPEIPRIETIHDISEEEKHCACGQQVTRIRVETCEKLEVIPARIRVRRHVRPRYACHACEGSGDESRAAVRIAPPPAQLLPRSIASPALVAYIVVGKFCDSLPFYRQEKQFARIGVEISRQDMANWSIAVFEKLRPLRELMRQEIHQGPVVQIDETTVQVMGEPGRPNTSKSFMWVFLGGSPGQPVVDYQYHPTRSGTIPSDALRDYNGFIQTDGYEGYEELGSQPGVVHVGCWAHARRKFFEAKESPKPRAAPTWPWPASMPCSRLNGLCESRTLPRSSSCSSAASRLNLSWESSSCGFRNGRTRCPLPQRWARRLATPWGSGTFPKSRFWILNPADWHRLPSAASATCRRESSMMLAARRAATWREEGFPYTSLGTRFILFLTAPEGRVVGL